MKKNSDLFFIIFQGKKINKKHVNIKKKNTIFRKKVYKKEKGEIFMEKFKVHRSNLQKVAEIAFKEKETTKYIKKALRNLGLKLIPFKNMTGGYVDIGEGEPSVAVRTDIDALNVTLDSKMVVRHACGHDVHMTVTLCLIEELIKKKNKRPIRFIFQPAEEVGLGAKKVIETGVLDHIEFLYGMHVRPLEELKMGTFSAAIQHGASKMIEGKIHGADTHAARPHLASNSIEVGLGIMQELYRIHANPVIPVSIKFTSFHADAGAHNTIPGDAMFTIDVRSQTNYVMEKITERTNVIMEAMEKLNDTKVEIKELTDIKAAEPNQEAVTKLENAIVNSLGEKALAEPIITPGGEDFHEYSYQLKYLKTTMLGIGCGVTPGLHHPNMRLSEKEAEKAVKVFYELLKD